MKKTVIVLAGIVMVVFITTIYYFLGREEIKEPEKTITVAIYDPWDASIFYRLNIKDRFQKLYPNVNIEIEEWKDDIEYYNSIKIRAATGDLPDVMYMKPFKIMQYADYMEDLSDLSVVKDNFFRLEYNVDGKVLGLPSVSKYDYVYYWKDLFEDAGVQVPQTWEEFISVSKKLQEYYGSENPDFTALAVGARDDWAVSPYVDIIPLIDSGNGELWNDIANKESPFLKGTQMYNSFLKIQELFSSGVCGKDPLAIGHDEVVEKFSKKNAAMIMFGPPCLSGIESNTEDISELSTFYLPVRDNIDDTFYICLQSDNVLTVSKSSKNVDIAKDFVEFFFSENWYPDFIKSSKNDSSKSNYIVEKQRVFADADTHQNNKIVINYSPNTVKLNYISLQAKFSNKDLGLQLFIKDFDIDKEFERINQEWNKAKNQVDIN